MTQQLEIVSNPNYVLNPCLDDLHPVGFLPLDIETSGDLCWKHKIRVIALHIEGKEYLILPEYYKKEELTKFFQRIKDKGVVVICHKTKFDGGFIYYHYGVLLKFWCTMLGSQILRGGSRNFRHDLGSCLRVFLGIDIGEDKKEMQKSFLNGKPLTAEQLNYAASDTRHLLPLMEAEERMLNAIGLDKIVKLENKLTPVLIKMEAHGCLIDVVKWRKYLAEWEKIRKDLVVELDAELMKVFPMRLFMNINYGSSKQLLDLFKEMRLPVPTKIERKGKEKIIKQSVDEHALENYVNENPDTPLKAFIEKFKSYKEYDKLLSTYGESFLERLDENNYIHTEYGQCITTTGRLNSSNPNLQNLPSDKSGAGAVLRECFIAPPGYGCVTSDMSGAEIALAADFSKDNLLMRSLKEGLDMHSELGTIHASIIYRSRVKISKDRAPLYVGRARKSNGEEYDLSIVPKDYREVSKSAHFSKFYKGGPQRIYDIMARYINPVTPERERMPCATKISRAIDNALPKLSNYLDGKIEQANTQGYLVTTKLGRRRYFDTKVYGEAANAPIQGSNADAIKIAMIKINEQLEGKGRIAMSVHDETVSYVKDEYLAEAAEIIKKEMIAALQYFLQDIKAEASVKTGKHWEK